MSKNKYLSLLLAVLLIVMLLSACSQTNLKKTIKFGDAGWDSIKFHNAVAMYIIENGLGYKTEEISGTTAITYKALQEGDIDAYMEIWTDNIATYNEDITSGRIMELGVNFDDNRQGLYVPRYVIEGDSKRGIAPMAPELKSVADLIKYKDLFTDAEDKSKGRIYGSIPGWEVDKILYNKFLYNKLDSDFIYFRPGSAEALAAAFTSAYEKGEPIVGYYWEPTWLTGKYDMVLLEDYPYDKNTYLAGEGEFPSVRVTICANNELQKKAPEVVEFLKHYKTSSAITAEALAHIADTGASYEDAAKWFLFNNANLLSEWLPEDAAAKVIDTLFPT